jgi:hypothetical protein
MLRRSLFVAVAAAALLPVAAHAEMIRFHANLDGAHEVPPTDSPGIGTLTAVLDTKTKVLSYTLTYQNLSGPPIAAHFHGPANPSQNAPIVVPIPSPEKSPVENKAKLTDAQISDLMAGKWYVNIHTNAHKPGEIRGQVLRGDLAGK